MVNNYKEGKSCDLTKCVLYKYLVLPVRDFQQVLTKNKENVI